MDDHHLPKVIYKWDLEFGSKSWVGDVEKICRLLLLPLPEDNVLYDMETVSSAILHYSKTGWWEEVAEKPELRTYVQICMPDDPLVLATSFVKRYDRGLLAKLMLGILPLELEIGRYLNIKPEERFCRTCNLNLVEDEFHFLFTCAALQDIRSAFYVNNIDDIEEFMLVGDADKVYYLCQKSRIRTFAAYITSLYRKRRSLLYKPVY